jgi:hypothetical protein
VTDEEALIAPHGSGQGERLRRRCADGFLDEHMAAAGERASRSPCVSLDGRRDHDEVGGKNGLALVVEGGDRPGEPDLSRGRTVGIVDAGEREVLRKPREDPRVEPPHRAHAQDGHAAQQTAGRDVHGAGRL